MLRAGGVRVALDDTDPYRDCGRMAGRAPAAAAAEVARWQRDFEAAWQEIEREHEAYAPALAAGLTTLTPLHRRPGRSPGQRGGAGMRSGRSAVASPAGPGGLALLLIEEFQQAKLGAVLDLYDLYDADDDRLFPVPWGEGKSTHRSAPAGRLRAPGDGGLLAREPGA